MKLNFTLLIASLLFVNLSSAQTFNRCSTMEYYDLSVSEGLAQANQLSQMDQAIQQWISNNPDNSSQALITIPVVFHVIYANSTQNISDSRIMAQMDVLNRDYLRTNADTVNTPVVFHPVAASTDIQFVLANRDPNGNPTTGITRTLTSTSGYTASSSDMKFTAQGGHDIWDRNRYLNIWTVNFTDPTLGYAQFPNGPLATDGVVVDYRAVGGPLAPGTINPYHLGRTATHEIGHWLGLYHTFQGGCAGTSPTTCAASVGGGDQICDTPPVGSATYFCPSNKNSCTETPTDLPDMVTNFMDYTDDPCMNIFTDGQKTRMHAVLNTSRVSLFTSNGYVVGINTVESFNNYINIFPNPSTGIININTLFNELTSINIYVFNILGKKVYEIENQNLMRSKLEIDLSNHSPSIYNVVFESDGYLSNRKVNISR